MTGVTHNENELAELEDTHDLADLPRTRAHGALEAVTRGYIAAHGHPLEHDGLIKTERVRRRWALGTRSGMIVLLVIGVVLAVTAYRALPVREGKALDAPVEFSEQAVAPADSPPDPQVGEQQAAVPQAAAAPTTVVVHVAGQVNKPGVVELPSGARIAAAIELAGGLTADANGDAINLARVVTDGEQVYVPAVGEQVPQSAQQPAPASGLEGAPEGPGGGLVNINTADSALLATLPGVGPAISQRIIAWRTANGPFAAISDLQSVSGIGPAMMAKVTDLITVG